MWHVVHSFGDQNLAVAFLMSQFEKRTMKDIDFAECGDLIPENNVTLDKVFLCKNIFVFVAPGTTLFYLVF